MRQSTIIQSGRAIMGALQPFTGNQAVGQIRLRALAGKDFTLERYTYFVPIINNAQNPSWLFKVGMGPNEDQSWTIGSSEVLVDVYSNVGGQRHNVPVGTKFLPEVMIEGLDTTEVYFPRAAADFTGADNPDDKYAGIQDIAFYETFDGPSIPLDTHRSLLTQFPAVLVAFHDMAPVWGGPTTDQTRVYNITFSISVLVSKTTGDQSRRHQGMLIVDDIMSELLNLNAAPDGEIISNPNGVIIKSVMRESGDQDIYKKFYIYTILATTQRAILRTDRRRFNPWLRTVFNIEHPQSPVLAHQGSINVVGPVLVEMDSGQIDVEIDGMFARAGVASYWDGADLTYYVSNERRIVDGRLLLEPVINNPLGSASDNLTLWGVENGAMVGGSVESNPAGDSLSAYTVLFDADADSAITLPAQTVALGKPIVFYVFAKAYGSTSETIRLAADDGVSEQESPDLQLTGEWQRVRFEFIPSGSTATLKIKNATDATSRTVALWGACCDVNARWGAELGFGKPRDVLSFTGAATPRALKTGRWTLELKTLPYIPADMIGTGLTPTPALVCVGNGITDLILITMIGTPNTSGSSIFVYVRGAGLVLQLDLVYWTPGATLRFSVDAQGALTLEGTRDHDGVYKLPRFDGAADLEADFLVLGSDSTGTRGSVPGLFTVVIDD